MKTCKYCGREANERGYTNHTGSCAGLVKVVINQLQHDVLTDRIAQIEAALVEATDFVDRHSESWYKSGQELLAKCRTVLCSDVSKQRVDHDELCPKASVTLYDEEYHPECTCSPASGGAES